MVKELPRLEMVWAERNLQKAAPKPFGAGEGITPVRYPSTLSTDIPVFETFRGQVGGSASSVAAASGVSGFQK